jgi:hypothetical protein
MLGAFRKETFRCMLACNRELSGSQNVTKSLQALQFDLPDDPSGEV